MEYKTEVKHPWLFSPIECYGGKPQGCLTSFLFFICLFIYLVYIFIGQELIFAHS